MSPCYQKDSVLDPEIPEISKYFDMDESNPTLYVKPSEMKNFKQMRAEVVQN